jgi:hypothetical protein
MRDLEDVPGLKSEPIIMTKDDQPVMAAMSYEHLATVRQ